MAKKDQNQDGIIENVEETLSRTEQFIEDNQKIILTVVGVIALIVVVYIGYNKLILEEAEKEAVEYSFPAQQYFAKDSMNLAINGADEYEDFGFLEILEDYSSTKIGDLSDLYIGIANMREGDFETAIDHLNSFSTSDDILTIIAEGLIGDAYVELEEIDDAISAYKSAVSYEANDYLTPLYLKKLATLYESNEDYTSALEYYSKIKEDFKKSKQGQDIDKYISKAKILSEK